MHMVFYSLKTLTCKKSTDENFTSTLLFQQSISSCANHDFSNLEHGFHISTNFLQNEVFSLQLQSLCYFSWLLSYINCNFRNFIAGNRLLSSLYHSDFGIMVFTIANHVIFQNVFQIHFHPIPCKQAYQVSWPLCRHALQRRLNSSDSMSLIAFGTFKSRLQFSERYSCSINSFHGRYPVHSSNKYVKMFITR